MFASLPNDTSTLLKWSWQEIEPYYDDLARRTLDAGSVAQWLTDWTALDDRVSEMQSRREVLTSQNTADKQAEDDYNVFLDTIYPRVEAASQRLRERLLASGLEPEHFEVPLKKMRAEAGLFREANLPLLVEERKLSSQYDKIVGAQTVEWDGKEVTISQLRPVLLETDRTRRERAWRLGIQRQMIDRQALNELWKTFLTLRGQLAANAGKKDFREYRWQQLFRFDYTPDDCRRFHQAIETAVVPAAKRLYDKHRRQLGVKTLRPWDLEVDPLGRPPLKPFRDAEELKPIASSLFRRVDPQLGDYFGIMVRESLLDLDNRKNKAPGAYCTGFPMSHHPFIFMNGVGLHDDLQTLLHESGHAFHFLERDGLPYSQQKQVGMEFAEVASMSMELLAAPYLARQEGGVYAEGEAARARVEHLESTILFWPYMAVVDAFQQWVYENPDQAADASKCDRQWAAQWERFMGGVDWTGLEEEMKTGWHRKLHIFEVPFYYVEYGLAQLGAMQIWRNALSDQSGAVAAYRRALSLGGTVSLPELYAAAGAQLAFDAGTLGAMVSLAERTIEELERHAG